MPGPLTGTRIIELAGIGPGPFTGMMLADMGAEVISVDRPGGNPGAFFGHTTMFRNRRSIAVNLKDPDGVEMVARLAEDADGLIEGFRPGVAERLGVGPEDLQARNPKLVYGRMTGWGQDGPWAQTAGHDMNYIALAGALHAIGPKGQKPAVPLNLVGDFGGGGMLLAFGMVCGLLEAQRSGRGQVVDAAMVDGAAALMHMFFSMRAQGGFTPERGTNLLDGGAHFYDTYATKDGRHVAIGAIEPQFYAELRQRLSLDDPAFDAQLDPSQWPKLKELLAARIAELTRDQLDELLGGTDACYAPILELGEVHEHPHNAARGTFIEVDGVRQPAPAPRFSRSSADQPTPSGKVGRDTTAVLAGAGLTQEQISGLIERGVVAQA